MTTQKKVFFFFFSAALGTLNAMQQAGCMDADWFYDTNHPFAQANAAQQVLKWKKATLLYKASLYDNKGTEDDNNKAKVNLAACIWAAEREATEHWAAFDALLGIEQSKRLSAKLIESVTKKEDIKVLVDTGKVGIGDIVHFLPVTIHELKKRTGWDVVVVVRKFLKDTIADMVTGCGCKLFAEGEVRPQTDYETHMIGLLGILKLSPAATNPDRVMFTAPERAINVVNEQINSVITQGKNMLVVVPGEDRQATLIGGKQLPHNPKERGRHLIAAPFVALLKNRTEIMLMDCGGIAGRITVDEDQKDRYMLIGKEEQAFDTIVALGRIMSLKAREKKAGQGKVVAIAADCGPANVLARCLDAEAQYNMTFIIPNPAESDMRMHGKGSCYKQMISNCNVMKCATNHAISDSYMVKCLPGQAEEKAVKDAYLMMTK